MDSIYQNQDVPQYAFKPSNLKLLNIPDFVKYFNIGCII